jgi:hypothetical protein
MRARDSSAFAAVATCRHANVGIWRRGDVVRLPDTFTCTMPGAKFSGEGYRYSYRRE